MSHLRQPALILFDASLLPNVGVFIIDGVQLQARFLDTLSLIVPACRNEDDIATRLRHGKPKQVRSRFLAVHSHNC